MFGFGVLGLGLSAFGVFLPTDFVWFNFLACPGERKERERERERGRKERDRR